MEYVTDIDEIKATTLINASIQAYNAFDEKTPDVCQQDRVTAPEGYDFVEGWTGVDAVFGEDRTAECYGVVFRSQQSPFTYIFAFRGTSSFLDMLDDAGTEHTAFVPHDSRAEVPTGVRVEAGFFSVYTDRSSESESMQRQLFLLIEKYNASDHPISQLYITGHSLGSALSELFTLDVAVSQPALKAINYNFACPRVGNKDFVTFYQKQPAQLSVETRTIRIQNTHDIVPCVPLKHMEFRHISPAYLVAFTKAEVWDEVDPEFILHNHSAVNYQAVLDCAFSSPNRVCISDSLASPAGYLMHSKAPDERDVCRFW